MFKKFFDIFRGKKTRFRDSVKKEKARFYMFSKKKSTPFFCKRKKSKQFQIKFNYKIDKKVISFFILGVLVLSFLGLLYIFKGGYFSIQKINIFINDGITDENIAYKSLNSIRNKSIFLETKEHITKKLLDYQKNIKKVYIDRVLPNTLNINIDSYPIVMDILYANKQYSLTSNGVVVPIKKKIKVDKKEKFILNIANTKEDRYKIITYKKLFKAQLVKKIYILITSFKDNILNLQIKNITLYRKERELHIETKNNTIFIFSLEEDVQKQLKNLIVYSKEKKNSLRQIYIDLRIKNKIFVCPYTSEFQCKRNLKRIYK